MTNNRTSVKSMRLACKRAGLEYLETSTRVEMAMMLNKHYDMELYIIHNSNHIQTATFRLEQVRIANLKLKKTKTQKTTILCKDCGKEYDSALFKSAYGALKTRCKYCRERAGKK